MFFQRLSALFVVFLSIVSCGSAAAEPAVSKPKLSILPPLAAVAVEPAIAPPGTARKIIVAGMWPNSCVPTGAKLGLPPSYARTQAIGILLSEQQTFQACFSAFAPYRFELDYTPEAVGQVEVLVMTNQASPITSGWMITATAEKPKAFHDVSGTWFDPATAGSGLMISHDYGNNDDVFATWHVYDPATGATRWYWIQQGDWKVNGLVWEGFMFESTATPSSCAAPCAMPLSNVIFQGSVRLTFSPSFVHGNLDATMDFTPNNGTQRRASNLQRFIPRRLVIQ
ncbi:hypothetical protein DSM104443_03758 [Usitatibacter rugosus]|uniref:Uncharacterized protein n=1 Tax=Usitatibacter rugosus TaxID=2732067 RepID=A0A6M4GZI2_9PROT|nr:hypothetical protein [Usitatibacter rugosus]QJR12666.1 hypothetical protein DSM104443_03758 [Usitatibacter rugosus]